MAALSSPFFLAQITDTSGAPAYGWVEGWLVPGTPPAFAQKVGGRFGTAAMNPGYTADGSALALNQIVLCRSADGVAGLIWELVECAGFTAPPSSWKSPAVRIRTATALPANAYANGTGGVGATLTGSSNGALSAQDGVTPNLNDDLLVANEAAAANNGIYTLTQVGSGGAPYILTRRTDADTGALLLGAVVAVTEGSVGQDTVWMCGAVAAITVGTTSLPWVQIGGSQFVVSGSAYLGSAYTINPTGGFQSTGLVLTLPIAASYKITCVVCTAGRPQIANSSGSLVYADLLSSVTGVIVNSQQVVFSIPPVTCELYNTSVITFLYSGSGGETLTLRVAPDGVTTWNTLFIGDLGGTTNAPGRTHIDYEQIL